MVQLLMVVAGLSLSSMVMLSLNNYLPSVFNAQKDTEILIEKGFTVLEEGFDAYTSANADTPPAASAGWDSDLSPGYIFLPRPPTNLSWSYGSDGGTGYYFCLTGSFTQPQFKGFKRAESMFSASAMFLCRVF